MCGIAGVWSTAPLDAAPLAERLDAALAHRGPDGKGHRVLDAGHLLLVHRRLAIIDTAGTAAQPMTTMDGRHTIVFNGEIYNHADLRRTLELEGERFITRSDTEVLLRLLVRRGLQALADVRGMFAFGWWDATDRALTISRDRFGIKPCYVASDTGRIAFASEVGALRRAGFGGSPDPAGILGYLRWGAVPPPLTWITNIHTLTPGTWQQWRDGQVRSGAFADAREIWTGTPATDIDALRERTRDALRDTVQAHLVADVPVGMFLSGGIDSAAIVATAAACGKRLRTFTVIVDEAAHNEASHAARVAEQFGSEHHTLLVNANTLVDTLPSVLNHLDQPTFDGVNSYLVSSAVAATGVKAVISGIGGDEAFGGYPSFRRVARGNRLRFVPRAIRVAASNAVLGGLDGSRNAKLSHVSHHSDSTFELYRAVRGWMMPAELNAIVGPALRDPEVVRRVDAAEQVDTPTGSNERLHATVARFETTMYLRQQLLRDTDVMSMAHGLEVRTPFVDHRLLEAVWPALGGHPGLLSGKRLLVESVHTPLPASIVQRPKQGFTLPFEHWLDGPLASFIGDGLHALERGEWITRTGRLGVERAWRKRSVPWSRPWGLAVLGHFLSGRPA